MIECSLKGKLQKFDWLWLAMRWHLSDHLHQLTLYTIYNFMFKGWIWVSYTAMSMPITIVVTTLTTHNIKIFWMVHHIQTKRLIYLQQCKNSSQKHKKSNICKTKKTIKQKLMFENPKSPKLIWYHTRWDYIPQQNISNLFTPKLIWN
jgi:hypothetical protein